MSVQVKLWHIFCQQPKDYNIHVFHEQLNKNEMFDMQAVTKSGNQDM